MSRRHKAHPLWHRIQCQDCGNLFDEYSDPNASLELCNHCLHTRWGTARGESPLQKGLNDDAWWDNHVFEYERQLALGLIDMYGKSTEETK